MVCKGELSVVPGTQENREGIAEHSFAISGDVGLPSRFCTVLAEEDCLEFGFIKGQSRLFRSNGHFTYFWL